MAELLESVLAHHHGQSIAKVHKDTDRDFIMNADEAKDYGIVDEVIQTLAAAARTGKIGDGKIFVFDVGEAIRIRNDDRGEAAL